MAMAQCLKITQKVAFEFLNFVQLKGTFLVTLLDRKLQVFENSPKCTVLAFFKKLLFTQKLKNRFARNV